MKKTLCAVVLILLSTFLLTSCASNKAIKTAKDYVDEYYQNFSKKDSTQCFYQLNKNSSDSLSEKYGIAAEDLFSSRAKILGSVQSYEVLNEAYFKEGSDKFVDFEVLVKYQNVELNEKYQIIIKKDGQTSINILEFDEDNIANLIVDSYKSMLSGNDIESIKSLISGNYYISKTEKNLENVFNQASLIGGNLLDVKVISGKYIYEEDDNSNYVYEFLLQLNYENDSMQNKIKLSELGGNIAIGYIVILPEKILTFCESYIGSLKEGVKDNVLALYNQDVFEASQDNKDTKWNLLQSYNQAYGELAGYDVITYGYEAVTNPDGTESEAIRVDVMLNYKNKSVKHKLTLSESNNGYIIEEQIISDN